MTYDIKKVEEPESSTHYKFTFYKTVEDKQGNEVEIKDSETQYTLKDLESRKDSAQEQVNKWQSLIDDINKMK